MIDWNKAVWIKSSFSDSGNCVEVARVGATIGVRDTKAKGAGPILEFTETEWGAFLEGVLGGQFDVNRLGA